ncbi:lytic murein transglycosylase [Polycladidibacter stylochi]|uniref:lytic murein transglycosylase n=1 Tax=Polycladidibacter stylochi TaxID=1807766 RepID=UPI0008333625|nr:lytic murein transglycosylase [Pseudovibrio stylochi]
MTNIRKVIRISAAFLVAVAIASPAFSSANSCGNTAKGFKAWQQEYAQTLKQAGITEATLRSAFYNQTYNSTVIKYDRNQKSFKKSFEDFYKLRVNNALINKGRRLIKKHNALFNRIERDYGVPREIIVAIWGLETSYGGNIGKMSTLRALSTLAYDCRRADFFRNELYYALLIIQKGDLAVSRMKGAWAGELGQTQFLASSYVKFAVDYDGDGKRDLLHSVPDVLGSTAAYMMAYGWQTGEPWGPGTNNYEVIRAWNKAGVYIKTIQVMAEKLKQ